jgi:hypothetical protein
MPQNTGVDKDFYKVLADLENFLAIRDIYKEGNDGFTYRDAVFTPYIKRRFIGKDKNWQRWSYRIDTQAILCRGKLSVEIGR